MDSLLAGVGSGKGDQCVNISVVSVSEIMKSQNACQTTKNIIIVIED